MLRLLQSIFGRDDHANGGYASSLIEAATQRAIDATDRRLHAVSGSRKRLASAVESAVDHVVKLVDSLAVAVPVNSESYLNHPLLHAMFASQERMFEVMARDATLLQALRDPDQSLADGCCALLIASMSRRITLGSDMVDGVIRQDVMQTVVSFDAHRLVDVTADEEQTRRLLKRRAYDVILRQILQRLEERQSKQQSLQGQRKLVRRKHELLQQAGWDFAEKTAEVPDTAKLEQQLQEVEDKLAALGSAAETLEIHLELLKDALSQAPSLLSLDTTSVTLDHRNVERESSDEHARLVPLQILKDQQGNQVILLLLRIEPQTLQQFDAIH